MTTIERGMLVCGQYMTSDGAKFGWPCSLDPAHPGGHEHAADYWPRNDEDTCAPDPAEPTEAA